MGEGVVYVGIEVHKTDLVVAVRPSGESFTLAYCRTRLKQLVGRLGKLLPKVVVVEATGGLQRQIVPALLTGEIALAAVNLTWVRSYESSFYFGFKIRFHGPIGPIRTIFMWSTWNTLSSRPLMSG